MKQLCPGSGGQGVYKPQNMAVLAGFASVCKVKKYRKLCKTDSKISLVASLKIWLARRSDDWAPGQFIKA